MSRKTYPSGAEKRKKAALMKEAAASVPQLTQFFAPITPTASDAAVGQADRDEDVVESDESDDEPKIDLPKIAAPDDEFDELTADLQSTVTVTDQCSDDIVIADDPAERVVMKNFARGSLRGQ